MDTPLFLPLSDFIATSKRLLVVAGPNANVDTLAAASALGKALSNETRSVTVATVGEAAFPEPLLPLVTLETDLAAFRALEIRLGVKTAPLQEFMYDVKNDELKIELLSKSGAWSAEDVRVEAGALRFDAVFALNVGSAREAASLLPTEPEWIGSLPSLLITTDVKTGTSWAKQTITVPSTTNLSEEAYAFLKAQKLPIDKGAAHNLLTGLIAATNGFRGENLRAATLEHAAELIELGADRQAIMNRLWRVLSVPTLNLWGRALMRLTIHPSLPLAYTVLTDHDFLQAKTNEDGLPALGKYLLDRLPEQKLCLVLTSWNGKQTARLYARSPLNAQTIAERFKGTGTSEQASWTVEATDLLDAQRDVLAALERGLPALLSAR